MENLSLGESSTNSKDPPTPRTRNKDNNTEGYNGQIQRGSNERGHLSKSYPNRYTQPRIYHSGNMKIPIPPRGYRGHIYRDLFDSQQASDKAKEEITSSSITIISIPKTREKKLIILDVNGLLADVISPPPKCDKADITIKRRAIFKRPFLDDFLRFCFERFDVALWSSRSKKILDNIVDYLLGDMRCKLLFCWDQSQCTNTGFKTLENKHKDLFLKELKYIWKKYEGDYDESNTLLLDDSPYKALLNPIHSSIFPHSYSYKDKSDNSLGSEGDLRIYLTDLAKTENVKIYVKEHPFGQQPLDKMNPSWAYYLKVIDSQ